MKTKLTAIFVQNKNIIRIALATAFILLLPLLAMRFTDEVVWNLADFAVAGALLFGTGLAFELIVKKTPNVTYRVAAGIALAAAFILVWANLAVGLIGSEDASINLIYFGVLLVGISGALIARFQAKGMGHAMLAMALAQVMVTVIALIAGMHKNPGSSVFEILIVNGFFVALFVLAAFLFQHAGRTHN